MGLAQLLDPLAWFLIMAALSSSAYDVMTYEERMKKGKNRSGG